MRGPVIGNRHWEIWVWERPAARALEESAFAAKLRAHLENVTEATPMSTAEEMKSEEVLRVELEVFRREHRDLDEAIHAMEETHRADQLRLRRLKKQKLALKDKIAQIEDQLTPDIIA
jgi:hypothetical protein